MSNPVDDSIPLDTRNLMTIIILEWIAEGFVGDNEDFAVAVTEKMKEMED